LKKKVYFRADGNSRVGLGHVIRSLALAEVLKEDFHTVFIIINPSADIKDRILKVCHDLHKLPAFDAMEEEASAVKNLISPEEILVLDGYAFDADYQRILKERKIKLVCIDDQLLNPFLADAIINHTSGISSDQYQAEYYTRFYLGVQYALLRKSFSEAAQQYESVTSLDSVFINFGGADPENHTCKALQEVIKNPCIKTVHVVTGSAYLYAEQLGKLIENINRVQVSVFSAVDESKMLWLMKQSSIAICAASTIAYEYCCVGGGLFIIKTAENQKYLYDFLIKNHLALDFELFSRVKIDADYARQMASDQKKYFTGKSGRNLRAIFNQLRIEDKIKIRKAEPDDVKIFFDWANDPVVRMNSINKSRIEWDSHTVWFKSKLADRRSFLLVCALEDELIGQLRFDFLEDYWLISFSVGENFRGKGLAEIMVYKSIAMLRSNFEGRLKLKAQVQEGNISSSRIFMHLGFTEIEQERINGFLYKNYSKSV
jgi:UDP-2,4-diacetamido-2,4,6-trideoxy-beta-L-altropyranose hydrolase